MSKRGDFSIGIIFSVLITVVAIGLVLLLASKQIDIPKKLYCDSIYRVRTLYGYRDKYCEDLSRLGFTSVERETEIENLFTDRKNANVLLFNDTVGAAQASVKIPTDSRVNNAIVTVGIPKKEVLTRFNDNKPSENFIYPPFGDTKTFYVELPNNARIKKVRFELTGRNVPPRVDEVFVIDTSLSMADEWNTLCNNLNLLEKTFRDIEINVSFRIFGIGEGLTYGKCLDGMIKEGELLGELGGLGWGRKSISAKGNSVYATPPFDEAPEAWGLAILWVMNRYAGWRENSKRNIIPISDSDPTGGAQLEVDMSTTPPKWIGEAQFTGNEEGVIEKIKQTYFLKGGSVYPIYGNYDESDTYPEGFHVGTSQEDCVSLYPTSCGKILGWMRDVSYSTDGNFTGYRDLRDIRGMLLKSLYIPYPKGVSVSLGGFRIFIEQELNESSSPVEIEGDGLVSEMQKAIDSCTEKTCRIPITISMDSIGSILVDKLRVEYVRELSNVSVGIGDEEVARIDILSEEYPTQTVNITERVVELLNNCMAKECEIGIDVLTNSTGIVLLNNLSIDYKYYPVEEILTSHILECWKQNGYGYSTKSEMCEEFVIPPEYRFLEPITEKSVTGLIVERKICHLFENNDFGCGGKDNLEFSKDINNTGNILIEYDAGRKMIVVS